MDEKGYEVSAFFVLSADAAFLARSVFSTRTIV
jgi:hypothetical protein